jgi:hypothetical protein
MNSGSAEETENKIEIYSLVRASRFGTKRNTV